MKKDYQKKIYKKCFKKCHPKKVPFLRAKKKCKNKVFLSNFSLNFGLTCKVFSFWIPCLVTFTFGTTIKLTHESIMLVILVLLQVVDSREQLLAEMAPRNIEKCKCICVAFYELMLTYGRCCGHHAGGVSRTSCSWTFLRNWRKSVPSDPCSYFKWYLFLLSNLCSNTKTNTSTQIHKVGLNTVGPVSRQLSDIFCQTVVPTYSCRKMLAVYIQYKYIFY